MKPLENRERLDQKYLNVLNFVLTFLKVKFLVAVQTSQEFLSSGIWKRLKQSSEMFLGFLLSLFGKEQNVFKNRLSRNWRKIYMF